MFHVRVADQHKSPSVTKCAHRVLLEVSDRAKRFLQGHWSFFWLVNKWKLTWNVHLQAQRLVEPLCRFDNASSPRKWTSYLSRNKCVRPRIFEKQGGKISVHYEGDWSTAELFFRIIISVNQCSVNGAISDWKNSDLRSLVFQYEETCGGNVSKSDCWLSPDVVSILTNPFSTNVPVQGNLLRSHNTRFETLQRTCKWWKRAKPLELWERGVSSLHFRNFISV